MKRNHRLIRMLADADKPIVAAVEGYAVGAGAGIALATDTIVMGEGASMAFPFLRLGLVPDYGLMYTLPRRVGAGPARQLLLYAGKIGARDALRAGIADHLVPDEEVQDKALALAEELAGMAPVAMRMAKRMMANVPAGLETVLELEALSQSLAFTGDELPEGLAAFREKRTPEF
jgi:2-(1,2-epoxy-1,2-dihydrophenyl)acetyl-CoA isomerase